MGKVIPFPQRPQREPSAMAALAGHLKTLAIYDTDMSEADRERVLRICDSAIRRG